MYKHNNGQTESCSLSVSSAMDTFQTAVAH